MADKNLASAPPPDAGVHVAACVSNPVPLQKLAADKEGLSQAVKSSYSLCTEARRKNKRAAAGWRPPLQFYRTSRYWREISSISAPDRYRQRR